MELRIGDVVILASSTGESACEFAREVVYIGPGLVCMCFLLHNKCIMTYGYNEISIQELLYRYGDEMKQVEVQNKPMYGVDLCTCSKCNKVYNAFYHTACPYCTPGVINPLIPLSGVQEGNTV